MLSSFRPFWVDFFVLLIAISSMPSFGHGTKAHDSKQSIPEVIRLKPAINETINSAYLDKVKPIFVSKCFNCHSDKVQFPWYYNVPVVSQIMDSHIKEAKSHLDISRDYPFLSHGGQKTDLEEIIIVTQKDKMPPWYYTPFHKNSNLSDNEKRIITDWAHSSLDLIKKEEIK